MRQKSEFKKVSPKELTALGLPAKSEQYRDLKTGALISKRQYVKQTTGENNEQRAKNIKSGKRPLAPNAPVAARREKIRKSFEKKATKKTEMFNAKHEHIKMTTRRFKGKYQPNEVIYSGYKDTSEVLDGLRYIVKEHGPKTRTVLIFHTINAKNETITRQSQLVNADYYLDDESELEIEADENIPNCTGGIIDKIDIKIYI